jgi:hypothetical protein
MHEPVEIGLESHVYGTQYSRLTCINSWSLRPLTVAQESEAILYDPHVGKLALFHG